MNATMAFFGRATRRLDPRAPNLQLDEALAYFARRRSVHLLLLLFAGTLAVRVAMADWRVWDLAVVLGLVLLHPLTEWLIHVGILHFRPRSWRGHTVDFPIAHDHRAHHAAPHDPQWWFMPAGSLATGYVLFAGIAYIVLPTLPLAVTAIATMLVLATVYEWTHFLCHSSWRPRSAWFRRLWRLHRLHHFKNENYWMGVTMHAADRVLGTLPEATEVETSPTCRNLDQR